MLATASSLEARFRAAQDALPAHARVARAAAMFAPTGGITSVAYGEPRMTQDIDIVVDNAALARGLDDFLAAAAQAGFLLDPAAVRRAVAERSMFQLFDMAEALKIDIYPREMIPGELDRSARIELFVGLSLPVVARADAAASKLAGAGIRVGPWRCRGVR